MINTAWKVMTVLELAWMAFLFGNGFALAHVLRQDDWKPDELASAKRSCYAGALATCALIIGGFFLQRWIHG